MGVSDVLKKVFNVEVDFVDDDEDIYQEEEETFNAAEEKRSSRSSSSARSISSRPIPLVTGNNSTVILCEPEEFEDSPEICDNLKRGITVVVNMETVDSTDAKKIFDFLSGAIYVLEGSMKKVADNVFILAPKGVDIKTSGDDSVAYEFE